MDTATSDEALMDTYLKKLAAEQRKLERAWSLVSEWRTLARDTSYSDGQRAIWRAAALELELRIAP